MSSESWFAASLVVAVLSEGGGLLCRWQSVVLVRASDFEEAFEKACRRGFQFEERYLNGDGEEVRWAFERVETLDMLRQGLSDGVEVYSEAGPDLEDRSVPFETEFDPVASQPDQTGI